jgi:hypothetical protein
MTTIIIRSTAVMLAGVLLVAAACERAPGDSTSERATCAMTRGDTLELAKVARDTIAQLKGRPQVVKLIGVVRSGVSVRTEDADSAAFHNGGAVSFDCAKHVTAVWLDAG